MAVPARLPGLVALGWVVLIVASIALVDRPAASFAHVHLAGVPPFVALTHLVDPLLPLAVVGFLSLGIAFLLGVPRSPALRLLFCLSVATLLAVITKDQLKFAFGRTWPETWVQNNPSWIRNGVSGFTPFHGGPGWASFPSGHMTLASAPAAVLVLAWRSRWRWLLAVPVLLVAIGLYGADYHYVGDILAGTLTGTLCAAIVTQALSAGRVSRP